MGSEGSTLIGQEAANQGPDLIQSRRHTFQFITIWFAAGAQFEIFPTETSEAKPFYAPTGEEVGSRQIHQNRF